MLWKEVNINFMFPTPFFKSVFEIIKRKEWIGIFKLCLHFFISIFAVIAVCVSHAWI